MKSSSSISNSHVKLLRFVKLDVNSDSFSANWNCEHSIDAKSQQIMYFIMNPHLCCLRNRISDIGKYEITSIALQPDAISQPIVWFVQ